MRLKKSRALLYIFIYIYIYIFTCIYNMNNLCTVNMKPLSCLYWTMDPSHRSLLVAPTSEIPAWGSPTASTEETTFLHNNEAPSKPGSSKNNWWFLVGGFNPLQKYSSKWIISPGRDETKNIWNHHLGFFDTKTAPRLFDSSLGSGWFMFLWSLTL